MAKKSAALNCDPLLVVLLELYHQEEPAVKAELSFLSFVHSQTRSRQNLWINGKKTQLPKDDPGGEHE